MKIAVLADLHLGFDYGGKREEDSFANARKAFNSVLKEKPDLILLLGDVFHDKVPKPEILARALNLFSSVKKQAKKVKIIRSVKNKKEESLNLEIPGLIGIYGTHEMRNKDNINPIHILEEANLFKNLHYESIIVEIENKERIGLHGLSGIPDIYVSDILKKWNPAPFKDISNILMLHQSFKELLPMKDPRIASYADLPQGFSIYLLGHIHWRVQDKHPLTNAPILIPGSTILTQMKSIEAKQNKGYYILEFTSRKINILFKEIDLNRNFFFVEKKIQNGVPYKIIEELNENIEKLLKKNLKPTKPIIKFRISGSLAEGNIPTDLDFSKLVLKYGNKALLYFDKSRIESSKLSERTKVLFDLKSNKISIEELGLNLLIKNLNIESHDGSEKIKVLFSNLAEGNLEKAEEVLEND